MIDTKWKRKQAKYLQPLSAKKAVSESGIDSKHCVNRSISGKRSTQKPKDWTKRERTLGVI